MVGLIPLFAVEVIDPGAFKRLPEFTFRLQWYLNYWPDLAKLVSCWIEPARGERHLLSPLRDHRMNQLLRRALDETEFLSDYGVRGVSKAHTDHPYGFECHGWRYEVRYVPGESSSGLFGGNPNWRGPIWMRVNFLLIEAPQGFHCYSCTSSIAIMETISGWSARWAPGGCSP